MKKIFSRKKRSRVKDTSDIPPGPYCYTPAELRGNTLIIKLCSYWKKTEKGGKCNLLKIRAEKYSGNLIWDQCKECNIKFDE